MDETGSSSEAPLLCFVCGGSVTLEEGKRTLTQKGIDSILRAAEIRQDDVGNCVKALVAENKTNNIKFHASCRQTYINPKTINIAKKRRSAEEAVTVTSPVKRLTRSEVDPFDWNKDCFMCGKREDRKHGEALSLVVYRPNNIRDVVFNAAQIRKDNVVLQRLSDHVDPLKELVECSTEGQLPNTKDLMWVLMRSVSRKLFHKNTDGIQKIPMWVGFNTNLGTALQTVTVACYAPSVNGTPSNPATVYTALARGRDLAKSCGQQFHVHTTDQQLYAVAQQIQWHRPAEFASLVNILGGFHSACTHIACIGKLYGDGGLRDMLVDSGVYAGNTADQMLSGKQFHRAVRGLTMVFEALTSLQLEKFLEWASIENPEAVSMLSSKICDAESSYCRDALSWEGVNAISTDLQSNILPLLDRFRAVGREKSATFQYWDDLLLELQILLNCIRADREGEWERHVSSRAAMLPIFFACDKQNYSRWCTFYVLQMIKSLPEDLLSQFRAGNFCVRFTPGSFRGLWSDMGVKMSVIRDSKGQGGISGMQRKESAVRRWTVTNHILATYSRSMRIRSGDVEHHDVEESHEQETAGTVERDENHIDMILKHVKNEMTDPFRITDSRDLIHIGTGLVATKSVSDSLLSARSRGVTQLENFITTRLSQETEIRKSFYEGIKRCGIKTFRDLQKKSQVHVNGRTTHKVVKPEMVFQRALHLSKFRPQVDLRAVLSCPLTSVPSSLFKDDGSMRKVSNKADLLHRLEAEVQTHSETPTFSAFEAAYLLDAGGILHTMNTDKTKTFGDIGEALIHRLILKLNICDEVHFICDRYDSKQNPKSAEHDRRYGHAKNRTYEIAAQRPIPDWKKLLSSDENKTNLIEFLCVYVEKNAFRHASLKESRKQIVLAGGYRDRMITKCIKSSGCEELQNMSSNHCEADTRIVFHAVQCSQTKKTIIVESPDTDVFVLLLSHYKNMSSPDLLFHTGHGPSARYIPLHTLAGNLSSKFSRDFCPALPAIHAITGCDTVEQFYFISKKTAFSVATNVDKSVLRGLKTLFKAPQNDVALSSACAFTAALYDPKNKFRHHHSSINELRYQIAVSKSLSQERLPPSQPAFIQHVRRAAWQTHQWAHANQALIPEKDPVQSGWESSDGVLAPVYFEGPTSVELLQQFFCNCSRKGSCREDVCPCKINNIDCCNICGCSGSCSVADGSESANEDSDDPDSISI